MYIERSLYECCHRYVTGGLTNVILLATPLHKPLCTEFCGGMWLKLKLAGKEFGGLSLLFLASGRS